MKKIIIFLFVIVAIIGSFFYARTQMYFSHGSQKQNSVFKIEKGEGGTQIGENLEKEGIISNKIYFWLYLKSKDMASKIYPGEYLLSGEMTIPEIVVIITNPEKVYEKVLFKEGWTAKQMAEELKKHSFDGETFLRLVEKPFPEIINQFPVLADKPKDATLEGYLFPDTYYFSREATSEGILKKILNNTELRIGNDLRTEIEKQKKSIFEIITMASIVEREVDNEKDRNVVSGIFWNRLEIGQALQSDATLSYALEDKVDSHSLEQLKLESPYNTYLYKGLPVGPVSNPGLSAIKASIHPEKTNFFYFFTAGEKTIFSKTFEEHVANRNKYGI